MNKKIFKTSIILISLYILSSCTTLQTVESDNYFIEEKMVTLNNYDHYIDIRGTNRANPVLLILHGGPGWTVDSITKKKFKELEKDFTIVNWHQRGAGRSKISGADPDDMCIDVFVDDTVSVINYLRDEFYQDKIVLLGHSWGTLLGSYTAKLYPELIHAYIGVSQMTVTKDMVESSKEAAIKTARSKDDKSSVKYIKDVDLTYSNPDLFNDVFKFRDLLTELGGTIYGHSKYTPLLKYYLEDSDYGLFEKIKIYRGIKQSAKDLYPIMLSTNIYSRIEYLEVPYFLMQGKHDLLTREQHSINFYNKVSSPSKKYYLFENSAHSPFFEEPDKFMEIMRNEIKPICIKRRYAKKDIE